MTNAVRPDHYAQLSIQPYEIMKLMYIPMLTHTFKYIWRAGDKGDHETDLKKAMWYLTEAIRDGYHVKGAVNKQTHLAAIDKLDKLKEEISAEGRASMQIKLDILKSLVYVDADVFTRGGISDAPMVLSLMDSMVDELSHALADEKAKEA